MSCTDMGDIPDPPGRRSVGAVFKTLLNAQHALSALSSHDLDISNLSIIGRDPSLGVIEGAAFFMVPDFGPLLIVGPFISWVIDALQTPVIVVGLSALGAGLVSLGVPARLARHYEYAVRVGNSVVVGYGDKEDVRQMYTFLRALNPVSLDTQALPPEPAIPVT